MNILAAIILLGFLVFIHELGHFLAGVSMRVPVEVFSIGFGPTIFKRTIRGVVFQVAILPFGGYCKFKGENPDEITTRDTKDDFLNISPIKKVFIYFAGPLSNYLLAVVIFASLALLPTKEIVFSPQVDVYETTAISGNTQTTLAYKYGFRAGDIITMVNGKSVASDKDVMTAISDIESVTKNDNIVFDVDRAGESVSLSIPSTELISNLNNMDSSFGLVFGTSIVFDKIIEGSAADEVGLQKGDRVVSIDNNQVNYPSQLRGYIMARPNTKANLVLLRDGQEISREIFIGDNNGVGVIGVMFEMTPISEIDIPGSTVGASIGKAFVETKNYLISYVEGLVLLFTGKIPVRDSLAGPVRIIQVTSEVAKNSLYSFLQLGAILSLILFFMNLLPIPVVDGGMIIVYLIEAITRKKVNMAILSRIQMVGAVLLITLAVMITVNDITFLFK